VHVLIVGKSAFSRVISGVPVPISIAGHTVQFIRPLLSYALERGMSVSYAYPLRASESDCLLFDPDDQLPDGVLEVPFTDPAADKSPLRLGWLSVEASVRQAIERNGPIDWVVLASTFPLATVLAQLKSRYGFKLALFIRGHDGYKWLDPGWVAGTVGDLDQARHVCQIYRESLLAAEFVAVASEWLGSVVAEHGARWDAVVESPAAMVPGESWDKSRFVAAGGLVRRRGEPDPGRNWLVSAGRLHPDKHLDLAAEMFHSAQLPDWQLVLAGAGDPDGPLDAWLDKLLDQGDACVIEVPPRMIHALFQVSDAYLQTSVPSDSFIDARPSSVTSAAFHGKPVIVPLAAAGGAEESVSAANRAEYGFDVRDLDPKDRAGRAELLRRGTAALVRLRDEGLRQRIGAANRQHAGGSSVEAVFDRVWSQLG
jgi:glycosyltransferase involved in cell wall biosynthesis